MTELFTRHPGRRASHWRTTRNTITVTAGLLITAALLMAVTHPRHIAQQPHCLRSRNCVCREFGEWMPGQNRCPDAVAAARHAGRRAP